MRKILIATSELTSFQVVPSYSAVLPGYIPIGIRNTHMDMTKFEREDNPGFVAVAGELRRWTKEATKLNSTRISNSKADGPTGCPKSGDPGWRTACGQFPSITQTGSQFTGSTEVSGGSLFQGNYIG